MSCARSGGGVISRAKVRSVQLTMVKKNLSNTYKTSHNYIMKKKKLFFSNRIVVCSDREENIVLYFQSCCVPGG